MFSTDPLIIPAASFSLPLRSLILGYRQLSVPKSPDSLAGLSSPGDERIGDEALQARIPKTTKPTLLHATLQLPPPSTLNGLYSRRTSPNTLVTVSLYSNTAAPAFSSSPPPASILTHIAHDSGKWSLEGLASTDSALLGARGLWNFGVDDFYRPRSENKSPSQPEILDEGLSDLPPAQPSATRDPPIPPSLLSAGAEFYYSPLSSVVGLSTGLRFTTLSDTDPSTPPSPPAQRPLSGTSALLSSQASSALSHPSSASFPYTLTLTLTPLTGSLASTYSVLATRNLSFSSRFGFNVYSWESECVLGAEIWQSRRRRWKKSANEEVEGETDNLAWAREKAALWIDEAKHAVRSNMSSSSSSLGGGSHDLHADGGAESEPDDSVIKLRVDDGWNVRALWVGRYKELLVSAGLKLGPSTTAAGAGNRGVEQWQSWAGDGNGGGNGSSSWGRWKGTVGVEVSWSS